jgi:esterase/lipase superfamily enzyme
MSPSYDARLIGGFSSLLAEMPDSVRKDVLEILSALRADAYFVPNEEEYRVLRPLEGAVVCTKIDGWNGWILAWHLEFDSEKPGLPTVVLSAISPSSPSEPTSITGAGFTRFGFGFVEETEPSEPEGTRDLPPYEPPAPPPPPSIAPPTSGGAGIPLGTRDLPTDAPPLAAPPERDPNLSYVRVFYSTDREQLAQASERLEYGPGRSQAGELHYGECAISIPKTHKLGKLESPSILRLEFTPDPQKHIVLASIESLEEEAFLKSVADAVAASATREAFVFVHGYNVTFEDAARRTGQIAFDLNFVGAPIFYSWPSNGRVDCYTVDETNARWSQDHFKRFLCLLTQHVEAAKIHVIAHSMGNRVVCEALKDLSLQADSGVALDQIVLAAPDIDADTFKELAATLEKLSQHVTLYQSSKDKALLASKKIHGNPRAGEPILVIVGVDTIDASAVDTDFLGHSYFADTWALISDIHALLLNNEPVGQRVGMDKRAAPDGTYYAFRGA